MLPEKLVVFGQTLRPARSSSLDLKKGKEITVSSLSLYSGLNKSSASDIPLRESLKHDHPINTVGHQINRVPLYLDFECFLCK